MAAGLMGVCAGCIESTTLVKVKKDGSGTITLHEFFSPEISGMMSGMGEMVSSIATNMGGAEKKPAEAMDMFKDGAEKKAAKFGADVKMLSYASKTNQTGWKGYQAVYEFKDINKLTVSVGDMENGSPDSPGGHTESSGSSAFRFKFTPGATASLAIEEVKQKEEAPAKPEPAADGNTGTATADVSAAAEDMGAGMMQMMAPMMKGMRLSMLVQVDGAITETNAKYKSSKNPNVVILMDVPMDKMLGNAEAMKLMSSKKPEDKAKLTKLDIPGVRMEEDGKIVTIKFK
jgi:hypothetical protein